MPEIKIATESGKTVVWMTKICATKLIIIMVTLSK